MANKTTSDFRSVYANGLGFAITDNDCRISFGITDLESNEEIEESVAVFMSHRTMKVLALAASRIIDNYEETTGIKIAIDDQKMGRIDAIFQTPADPKDSPIA